MQQRNRELVLPPNTYAYVLDSTKGKVSAYVGPYKNSLSDTDQLVQWDSNSKRFKAVQSTDQAQMVWAVAGEGQYIVLTNPAPDNPTPGATSMAHPPRGTATESVDLEVGKRIIVPGPATFPLWPGQTAETIEGHHLRHNQYVLVRVYDADQAHANWGQSVVAPQAGVEDAATTPALNVPDFTMGQLIVIPGDEVSFYMPSTGLEVVREEGGDTGVSIGSGKYVRDAVTLETLEYCVLLDENGQKRFVRGPKVVFPKPTESFLRNEKQGNKRLFQAIELNDQSGIYIKVIAPYTEENGTERAEGDELFITGKEQAIYFPRAEHSIIQYGDSRRHFSIAIPAGEGRYVLNRITGDVKLERGPAMFLPDPRKEVVVRRILDLHDCALMYPGNIEAQKINQRYQDESLDQQDSFSEDAQSHSVLRSVGALSNYAGASASAAGTDDVILGSASRASHAGTTAEFGGDALRRKQGYSAPRTITLDTKYEGAVGINIWPGYAVLVTNKTGERRVEEGPKTVLLDYDETIMALELSTGRPKNDTTLLRTGYLRTLNNVVSDLISVETKDLVGIDIEVSYRVNFEGDDPLSWFSLENYVQVLTDHCRSMLRSAAKKKDIRTFYTDTIDVVRDTLLGDNVGGERKGLLFNENGMRVYDVEVLKVTIRDRDVADLLINAQSEALSGAIELSIAEDTAERTARLEELRRQELVEKQETAETEHEIALKGENQAFELDQRRQESALSIAQAETVLVDEQLKITQMRSERVIEDLRAHNDAAMERLDKEAKVTIERMGAVQPGLIDALAAFGNRQMIQSVMDAAAPVALTSGLTTADVLNNVFKDTPLADTFAALATRPLAGRSIRSGADV